VHRVPLPAPSESLPLSFSFLCKRVYWGLGAPEARICYKRAEASVIPLIVPCSLTNTPRARYVRAVLQWGRGLTSEEMMILRGLIGNVGGHSLYVRLTH
jgi:hypothetical protein